jgi:hypothetical protein
VPQGRGCVIFEAGLDHRGSLEQQLRALKAPTSLGGYCVDVTEEQLKNAPKIEQGEAGSKRTGPATRTSTIIGKSDTIGFWNRRDPSLQFGPQWRSVSQGAYSQIATAHISLTECPLGPQEYALEPDGSSGLVREAVHLG